MMIKHTAVRGCCRFIGLTTTAYPLWVQSPLVIAPYGG